MSALPFAVLDLSPLGPRDDEQTPGELVAAVLRVAAEEEQAAREAWCSTCDGGRYVVDGDDRLVRCDDCHEVAS